MEGELLLTIGKDGKARLYDDTYDITIHCESQEEQDRVCALIKHIPHWIPCSERMPEEEDSIFAQYYGTDRWRKSMFRKKSREVIVTSVFEDGELHTEVAHTTDGEWHVGVNVVPRTVIAWQPLPEPYKGEEDG